MNNLDELAITTIRCLAIDGTNKANSGHPGMALGSAPVLYTLFKNHFVSDPKNPSWCNRDRFILSAGHASMLLYSVLHLAGYKVSLDDLKNFRTLGSITPGHPEVGVTDGVDATGGPLGQGLAQAVGFALAERTIASLYPEGKKIMNHYTYCLCGDGCLEEGVSEEAIQFAGVQQLNKLIVFYDDNQVTLDGPLSLSSVTNVNRRFEASNWNVIEVNDANDLEAIDAAINKAKLSFKPTLIHYHSVIGYGAPKQGTNKVHGSPLGMEDGKITKVNSYHFDHEDFYIPNEVYGVFKETFIARGEKAKKEYDIALAKYEKQHKNDYNRFVESFKNDVSNHLANVSPDFPKELNEASRITSGKALNDISLSVFNLVTGCADVASSVLTMLKEYENITPSTPNGRNINWGIREFFMGCAQNGMLLHGGLRTAIGCFFVFSDYMKPALRMAALENVPAIYVFTHDSVAIGQDGPTHQPIEQLAMLRSIPNFVTIRPCDARETYAAYQVALESLKTPTAIVLSRQSLPLLESSYDDVKKGAYIIYKGSKKKADYQIIATGSEVDLAIKTAKALEEENNLSIQIVSMPSWELFEKQDEKYKESILSVPYEKRFSLELASIFGWSKYALHNFGIDTFGYSGTTKDILEKIGFTVDKLSERINKIIQK